MSSITIAKARCSIATKCIRYTPAGLIITDYPNEKFWQLREQQAPADAPSWANFLSERAADTASCCLYGQPIQATAAYQRRLLYDREDDLATLREVPSTFLTLDLDSPPVGLDQQFLFDPGGVLGTIMDSVPDLAGVAFAYSISSSAGFKPGIRAKAVVSLADALLPSQMRGWANAVNASAGIRLVDPAVLAPTQPIYFARPILDGVADPFPVRVGFRGGLARVRLALPVPASPAATTGVAAGGGVVWRSHLHRLGPQGFHNALLAAAGALVQQTGGQPAEPVATVIYAIVREAVLRADPGFRGNHEIERYASRIFWNDAIAHAARRQHQRLNHIAASVAGIRRS